MSFSFLVFFISEDHISTIGLREREWEVNFLKPCLSENIWCWFDGSWWGIIFLQKFEDTAHCLLLSALLLRSPKPFWILILCGWPIWLSYFILYSRSLENLSFELCALNYHSAVPWWGSIFMYYGGYLEVWRAHWKFYWITLWILSSPPFSLCSLSGTPSNQILAFMDLSLIFVLFSF